LSTKSKKRTTLQILPVSVAVIATTLWLVSLAGYAVLENQMLNAAVLSPVILISLFVLYKVQFSSNSIGASQHQLQELSALITNKRPSKSIEPIQLDSLTHDIKKNLLNLRTDRFTLYSSAKVLAYQKTSAESILRSIPDGVLVLDESGCVTYANKPFLQWYQLNANQIIGKLPYQWCERSELLEFVTRYRGSLVRRPETGKLDINPPGKPDAQIRVCSYPVFSSKDEQTIANTLLVFTDVTKEVLAQNSRDDFTAALAHELKTPLHAIGMYAETLLGEECEDEELRVEFADLITTEVENLTDLVRNMLSITKIETGNLSINRKTTKLNDLVNNIVRTLEGNAKEDNIKLIIRMPEGLDSVRLDKDLMRIAINNLMSNAIKYNRPNGEVRLEVIDTPEHTKIVISDTGIGIDNEDLKHVFDKFYRSDDDLAREKQGNGLGLSLVKEIINLHGGKLDVESVKGQGSVFTISLSKSNAPLAEVA